MSDFEPTHWSLVQRAASGETTLCRTALNELLQIYMPALQAHLVRYKRLSPDLAEEIIQGFVVENVVDGEMIQRADPNAGKFRSWLLKWLDLYTRNQLSKRKKLDEISEPEDTPDSNVPGSDAFDVQWAQTTMKEALKIMRKECRAEGQDTRWSVFESRLILPMLAGKVPMEYEEIVEKFKLESTAQAQNILVTGKRHFHRVLSTVIGRYCGSEDEVSEELQELQRILAMAMPSESTN